MLASGLANLPMKINACLSRDFIWKPSFGKRESMAFCVYQGRVVNIKWSAQTQCCQVVPEKKANLISPPLCIKWSFVRHILWILLWIKFIPCKSWDQSLMSAYSIKTALPSGKSCFLGLNQKERPNIDSATSTKQFKAQKEPNKGPMTHTSIYTTYGHCDYLTEWA